METRANYVAIGAFVLFVIVSALASLWWLYRSAEPGATQAIRIVFPEPVTGLSNGGSVLFNGIRVGEVTQLDFAPGGGDNVIALVRVNPRAPIKTDTTATLGFQGLTGVAYISMTGGSQTAQSLFADAGVDGPDGVPTITAETSTFTSVLDSARTVLSRLNTTLDEVNGIIRENRDDLTAIVSNVRTMSVALADASPDIRGLVSDIAGAGRAVAAVVPQFTGIVDRTNGLLSAIEPDQVTSIVTNLESFTNELPALGTEARQYVSSVGSQLDDAAGTLGEALRGFNTVVAAVDPQEIQNIVSGVDQAVGVVAERSESLGALIDNASAVSSDLRGVTAPLATRGDAIGEVVDNAAAVSSDLATVSAELATRSESIGTAIDNLTTAAAEAPEIVKALRNGASQAEAVLASIDVEAVNTVVNDVGAVASALAGQAPQIPAIVDSLRQTLDGAQALTTGLVGELPTIRSTLASVSTSASSVEEVAARLPGFADTLEPGVQNVSAVLSAIDAEEVSLIVSNAAAFSTVIAEQAEPIGQLITSASTAVQRVESIASALSLEMPQIRQIVDAVDLTAERAADFTARLPSIGESLQAGLERGSDALAALEPSAIRELVGNAGTFIASLADQRENIAALITNATSAAQNVGEFAGGLADQVPNVDTILNSASEAASSIRDFAEDLPGIGDLLRPAAEDAAAALDALNPEDIQRLLANASAFAETLNGQSETITAILTKADGVANGAVEVMLEVAARAPAIGEAIDNVSTATRNAAVITQDLQPAVRSAAEALAVLTPARVDDILTRVQLIAAGLVQQQPAFEAIMANAVALSADARIVAGTIAERAPSLGRVVDNADRATSQIADASARLPGLVETVEPGLQNLSDTLSALDPEIIASIQTDTGALIGTLAAERETIAATVRSLGVTATEAERIAVAFAAQLPQVQAAIQDVVGFARSLPGLTEAVQPGLENLSAVLSAIDSEAVGAIVRDVAVLGEVLAEQAPRVGPIMDGTQTIVANLTVASGEIQPVIDDVAAAVASTREFTDSLPALVDTVQPGLENLSAVLSSIDAEVVSAIVSDARTVSAGIAAEMPKIGPIVDTIGAAVDNARVISVRLRGELDTVQSALQNANGALTDARAFAARLPGFADTLEPGVQSLSETLSALDPDAITAIIDNVEEVTATVAGSRVQIETILQSVTNAADNIDGVTAILAERSDSIRSAIDGVSRFANVLGDQSPRLDGLITNASETLSTIRNTVGEIDGVQINEILSDLRRAAQAVGSRADEIGQAIDNVTNAARDLAEGLGSVGGDDGTMRQVLEGARRIVRNLEGASSQIGSVVENADRLLAGPVPGFVSNASRAALGVERVADAFASRADSIATGLSKFSRGGLDDLRALLNQGRVTLAAIERTVTSFDQDPSRVIFGGSNGPRYSPQRR